MKEGVNSINRLFAPRTGGTNVTVLAVVVLYFRVSSSFLWTMRSTFLTALFTLLFSTSCTRRQVFQTFIIKGEKAATKQTMVALVFHVEASQTEFSFFWFMFVINPSLPSALMQRGVILAYLVQETRLMFFYKGIMNKRTMFSG